MLIDELHIKNNGHLVYTDTASLSQFLEQVAAGMHADLIEFKPIDATHHRLNIRGVDGRFFRHVVHFDVVSREDPLLTTITSDPGWRNTEVAPLRQLRETLVKHAIQDTQL